MAATVVGVLTTIELMVAAIGRMAAAVPMALRIVALVVAAAH